MRRQSIFGIITLEKITLTANFTTLLDRFRALPANVQDALNAPEALAAMRRLDRQHPNLNATDVVLRVVTHDLPPEQIAEFLTSVQGLDANAAGKVRVELEQVVLGRLFAMLRQPPPPPSRPTPFPPRPPGGAPPSPAPQRPVAPRAPPTLPPQKPASAFYYHAEDEADIAKHRERLDRMQGASSPDANALADRIAADHGLPFPDPNLAARFRSIAVAALKGIRKTYDTKDLLTRSNKIGGLELPAEVADKLLVAFATHAAELKAATPGPASAGASPPAGMQDRTYMPSIPEIPKRAPAPRPVAVTPPSIPVPPLNLPVGPVAGVTPPPAARVPVPPAPSPAATPASVPAVSPAPAPPAPAPRVMASRGRPVVEDVRRPKRTVGPVDELGLLTVDDLRRLDRDPEIALTKVWNKLQNLGKESFTLFAEGVKAWRRSPLYFFYVAMGTESMSTGRAVDEVANTRHAQNQPTLSPREFALVADFNRQLRLS